MSKPETALKRAILDALEVIGVEAWSTASGKVRARRGYVHLAPAGTPDILGYVADGRLLGIEVKVPGDSTSRERRELQQAWRDRAARAGCVVGVARSVADAVAIARGNGPQSREDAPGRAFGSSDGGRVVLESNARPGGVQTAKSRMVKRGSGVQP